MPTATSVTSNAARYRVSPHAPIFKISLLSIALMLSDVGVVSPVLPDLAAHYPAQDQASIQGFISFPAIAALAATITAGALATRVGKRRLVLTGISLIVVGGLAPIFLIPITSYPVVLGVRLLAGFGMGLLQPLASSLVADFYEGQERRTLLGWQSSMVGAGGIMWSLVVSGLMTFGWMQAFLVYLLGLIMLGLVWRYIPEPRRAGAPKNAAPQDAAPEAAPAPRTRLPRGTIGAVALMFLMTLGFQAMTISSPFLASERSLADGSQVSLVMTVFGISSVVAGVLFSTTYRLLGSWTGTASLAVLAAGLCLGVASVTLPMLFATAVLIGLGFGTYMPFAINALNARANESNSAAATALLFSGAAVAGFSAPYYFKIAGGLVGSTTAATQFAISAATIVVTLVLATIYYQIDARWAREQDDQH